MPLEWCFHVSYKLKSLIFSNVFPVSGHYIGIVVSNGDVLRHLELILGGQFMAILPHSLTIEK